VGDPTASEDRKPVVDADAAAAIEASDADRLPHALVLRAPDSPITAFVSSLLGEPKSADNAGQRAGVKADSQYLSMPILHH
jgi:hypothetical protein